MVTRRQVLGILAGSAVASVARPARAAASLRYGYAAITWGNDYMTAIAEIAAAGYRGVQLRAGDGLLDRFGDKPAALRDLLEQKTLAFPVFSSGNLSIDPAREQEMTELHTKHAAFVRAAGGLFLQVIDERPKGRAVTADDYKRTGRLITELGKRVGDAGVTLVYHHHMNSTGERPHEVEAVLDAADRQHVRLLFDTAHYQQGGGDPAAAIRRYRDWIAVLHLKDVRDRSGGSGGPGRSDTYQFVELGRGRVDFQAVFGALNEINFNGWGVVELDRVPDAGRTPKESAEINRRYLVETLHQTL
ncbi:MAG TPA: TIM barrel protein [Vicinamibacterales bacterium]|nr:TIM barrel protein [Vicinamibacterales bacterium]